MDLELDVPDPSKYDLNFCFSMSWGICRLTNVVRT